MHRPDHNIQDEILKILDAQRPPTAYSESTRTMGFDDGAPEGDISYDSKPRVTLGQRFLERQNILNPNTPGFNKAVSFGIDLIPQTPEQGIAELALAPIANPLVKGVGKGLAYIGRKSAPILKKGLDQGKSLLRSIAESPTSNDILESGYIDVPAFTDDQVQAALQNPSSEMRFQATQNRGPNVEAIREATRLTSREMEEIAAEEIVARRQLSNRDLSIRDRTLAEQRPRTLAEETAILDSDRQFYEAAEREIRQQSTVQPNEMEPAERMREYHERRRTYEQESFDELRENLSRWSNRAATQRPTTNPAPEIIQVQSRTGPVIEGAINPKNIPKIQLNSSFDTEKVFDHKNYRIVEKSTAPKILSNGTRKTGHEFIIGAKGVSRRNINGDYKHSTLNFKAYTKDGVTRIKDINFGGTLGGERQSGLMLAQILDRFPGEWVINTADNSFTWDSLSLMVKSMMRRAKGVTFEKGMQYSSPSRNSQFSKKWNEAEIKLKANTSASVSPEEYAQKLRYVQQEVVDELMLDFQRSFARNSQGKLPKGPLAPWSIKTEDSLDVISGVKYGNITISSFYKKLAAFMGIPISQMPGFLENLDEE